MNQLKNNKKMMKVLSFIIMLSMLFGLVPAAAAAPADVTIATTAEGTGTILPGDHFKFVKLNSANTYYQAAWYKDRGPDSMNYIQKPINLGDWALLTFAIQSTQHIKIKVYEVDPSIYTWNDPAGVNLFYNDDPAVLEPWLSEENFKGYLKGYRIDDNIDFNKDPIAYKYVPADQMQQKINSYTLGGNEENPVEFTPAPEDPDMNLAYGFTGQSLMAALSTRFEAFTGMTHENEIIALLNGQEPVVEKQPQPEKELEPEKKPVPEPEKETPADKPDENTENVTQPEGEGPDANAGDHTEATTPEEQPEQQPEGNVGTPAENPESAPAPETDQQQSETFAGQDTEPQAMEGAAEEEQPFAVEPEPEPEQTPDGETATDGIEQDVTTPAPVDPQPEEALLPEEETKLAEQTTPMLRPANLPTDEEIIAFLQQAGLTGEVSSIMPLADGDYGEEYEGYIHNLIMWHGQVVDEEGNVATLPMVDEKGDSKYYCLVTEPVLPHLAQYNSFLVFQGSELPSAELGQAEFNELFKVNLKDPVDFLTGSFSRNEMSRTF